MKQEKSPKLLEFRSLMASIRTESASLRKMITSEEEEKEANNILDEFDGAIQTQACSTLINLVAYQVRGWRELVDE